MEMLFASEATHLLSASECAELLGVREATWRSLVSRRRAPRPCGFHPDTGLRVWDGAEVVAWLAARPGKGNHARGRLRTHPHLRTRPYSVGTEPGWQPRGSRL